jgi:hypothetical protein
LVRDLVSSIFFQVRISSYFNSAILLASSWASLSILEVLLNLEVLLLSDALLEKEAWHAPTVVQLGLGRSEFLIFVLDAPTSRLDFRQKTFLISLNSCLSQSVRWRRGLDGGIKLTGGWSEKPWATPIEVV